MRRVRKPRSGKPPLCRPIHQTAQEATDPFGCEKLIDDALRHQPVEPVHRDRAPLTGLLAFQGACRTDGPLKVICRKTGKAFCSIQHHRGVRHTWIMVTRGRGCERRDATLHGCRKGGLLFFVKGSLLWNFSIADDALILYVGD